jgi:hypothetical protein
MLINNQQMTNQEAFHNFTIIREYTIETGTYPCLASCKDGIYNGWQKCDYEVTATGSSSVNSNWIITLLIIVAWLLFVLCLVFNNNIIGFFAGMMLIIVGVFVYIQGIASVKNLLTEGTGIIHIGIGIIIMIITSYNLAKD